MARPIDPAAAAQVTRDHRTWIRILQQVSDYENYYKQCVIQNTQTYAQAYAEGILQTIPVEEINRTHQGIRVKTLRDAGFDTIADLHRASKARLAAINGISDEGAASIKQLTSEFLAQAKNTVRLRLSVDDQNEFASAIVLSVYQLKQTLALSPEASVLLKRYKSNIEQAIGRSEIAQRGLSWVFSSRAVKDDALKAYQYLHDLLAGKYAQRCSNVSQWLTYLASSPTQQAWQDFSQDPIAYFNLIEELAPGLLGGDDIMHGLPQELALAISEEEIFTDGLKCTLRRYQQWGVRYILHQKRVLLGDEMGLGKTVQAIAAMVSLKNCGATHFVVVCPASVLANWCREIEKHSVLRAFKVHGDKRESSLNDWLEEGGVAVTTYETTHSIHLPDDFQLDMVVVDEAHYIKNPDAQRTAHTKRLCRHAARLLFMTGTALENKVNEMIGLMQILQPRVAEDTKKIAFMFTAPEFREKVAPVYYRRKRDDVLNELPELIENMDWCDMGDVEEAAYEQAILCGSLADARRVSWHVDDLRYSSKAQRLVEIVQDAQEEGRKVIVFSFFLDTIEKICQLFSGQCMQPINGSVSPHRRQEIIDEFEQAPAGSILPAQILAGGTGLNIQTASVVVICEPQFKPSTENQAISRAYRMGQSRNVLVHRLLCEDTVDEHFTQLLAQKQAIFDAFADESSVARESFELDQKAIDSVLQQERERILAKREMQN